MRARFPLPVLEVPHPWRLAALVVVGIILAAFAAWLAGPEDDGNAAINATPVAETPVDPRVAELRRCQAIGEAGAHDAGCLAAWAESRRRFLGGRPAANPEH